MKILVLRLGAMGDILFTTPVLRALKKQYPSAHLTYVLLDKWAFVLKNNPSVDRLVALKYREPKALGRLRDEKFDLLINLHELEDGARICEALDAVERRGHRWVNGRLEPDVNSGLLIKNKANLLRLYKEKIHYPELYCRIAGVEAESFHYDFFPGALARWRARFFLRHGQLRRSDRLVALHLHSRGMESKQWRPQDVREVVRSLSEWRFVVLGYGPDRELTRPLEKEPNVSVSYAPMTVQAEILRRCGLFVGVDSGPRQIATAMGIPVLCLFGPRPAEHLPHLPGERNLSVDWPCAPCYESICPQKRNCLSNITPERVVAAIRDML